jgi:uracil-DNA glycosylase
VSGEAARLERLIEEIRGCRACVGEIPEPRPVVWVTSNTRLLICGQAPGRRVHESGRPFTDPSGERLRDWMGVDYDTFYADRRIGVAAMAFCFPGTNPKGGDFPPPRRCAELWRRRLLETLPQVELTLLVGWHAQKWALGERTRRDMTQTVAHWRDFAPAGYLPMPHPSWRNTAWLKRNPWFELDVIPYLRRRVTEMLDRPQLDGDHQNSGLASAQIPA